ncbi:MAG: peptidyl-prolyl cis-trans isomerase [Robiginitalea sp.]|nr:peptidyl-prolyl cis-trans isomerase [Robiginitalea sp.]
MSATLWLLLLVFAAGCEDLWRNEPETIPLARVGEKYLYPEDIQEFLNENLSPQDSAAMVSNLINTWATRELLLSRAKINLPEAKITEFESLISDYRAELYTRAYREALVAQISDTLVGEEEMQAFYENEKENFRLQEKIIQLRFIELPLQFLNREEVTDRLRRFEGEDLAFLDSVGVQFKKLHFNDSLWIPVSRVVQEIAPLTYENEADYLKNSQFFEMEDSTGVYLTKVVEVLNPNEIAPLSYIEPTIRQVLLNRRKMQYLRSLETDLMDEAIRQKEFEIYETTQE